VFAKFAVVPAKPLELKPAVIAAGRDRWTQEWTSAVLR
jgi:ABC-type thiamine transport system substrate-binding protein